MVLLENDADHAWEGLKARLVSAIILFAVAFICVGAGGIFFSSLVLLAAVIAMREWEMLTESQMLLLRLIGYPYIILPCACMLWLRSITLPNEGDAAGLAITVGLILVISATDIAAYFTGKRFGRHKLAPAISPNKTIEGLAGGVIAAALIALMVSPYIHIPHSPFAGLWVGPLLALLAQAGDLFKSWIKRKAGVKDTGTLIPGHGGVLDRIDGYMFTTPLLAFIVFCAPH